MEARRDTARRRSWRSPVTPTGRCVVGREAIPGQKSNEEASAERVYCGRNDCMIEIRWRSFGTPFRWLLPRKLAGRNADLPYVHHEPLS
jgi:hypothetical protein